MPFWSLNPYVGCEFGCSYCYARDTHRWVTERNEGRSDPSPADAFERRILVKTEVAEVVARTLDPKRVGSTALAIGTATDPYQPAERRFRLTRRVLQALLLHRGLTISITTKSSLVARDIDVLTALAARHDLSINLSLATVDPVLLRRLEPRTPLPRARLRALASLTRAGLNAGILIAPILPGLTDGWASLAAVMEAAKAAGARHVVGFALRLGPAARARFLPLLQREFPDLAARYAQHYEGRTNASRAYTRALARRIRLLREAYGMITNDHS
jgi:DNA repair photolyase